MKAWAHPVNIIVDEITRAIIILCNQFLFPGRRCPQLQAPTPWETKGRGSEEFLTRQGGVLRTKEAKEDWEERKGKKTTPEGSKFLTFSPPPLLWMITMNFVRESESCLHYCSLCDMIFHSVVSRIPCDQGASRNMLWRIHWWNKIVKGLSFVKAWGNKRRRLVLGQYKAVRTESIWASGQKSLK